MLKQWFVKIQQENIPLNKNSRVPTAHFKGGKKCGKDDVPVIFAWSKSARPSPRKQHFSSEAGKTLQSDSSTEETETVLQEILSQLPNEVGEEHDDLLDISTVDQLDEGSCDNGIVIAIPSSKEQKDVGIQNAAVMLDFVAQTCTLLLKFKP